MQLELAQEFMLPDRSGTTVVAILTVQSPRIICSCISTYVAVVKPSQKDDNQTAPVPIKGLEVGPVDRHPGQAFLLPG
jgi:hypothetical protein